MKLNFNVEQYMVAYGEHGGIVFEVNLNLNPLFTGGFA